jgi:hypothetical protein
MTYIAIANFAFAGKTYFVGDDAPFDASLLERGLIEPVVEDEDEDDGSV